MEQNICPICGSPYVYEEKTKRFSCRFCGYVKPKERTPEEEALLYSAAQRLRLADFDGANEAYEDIASRFPDSPEAHWGLALCEYGIKYEDDYDGKKIPTCYAARYESLFDSDHFKKAVSLADKDLKEYYESQAKLIERVRKEWVEKAEKEKPYDIFLSFKDTEDGNRTDDSYDAYEIYNNLTKAGYRVFFSRVTLAGKSGENFEPYIFAALNSAPLMLVFASKPEYVTSTWVKNEWMRYLARIRQKQKRPDSLCVIFKGFNPSSLPAVLKGKQNLKYGELTFLEDLKAYCDKVISAARAVTPKIERKEIALAKKKDQKTLRGMEVVETTSTLAKRTTSKIETGPARREIGIYQTKQLTASQESLLFQAEIYLSKKDFDRAQELYHQVLLEDQKNPTALLGDLLVTSHVTTLDEWISQCLVDFPDVTAILPLIDYSPKDISAPLLNGYSSTLLKKVKEEDYVWAEKVYSAICGYDVPEINELHGKLFKALQEKKNRKAVAFAEKVLPYLANNKEAYRLGLSSLISFYLQCGDFDKAKSHCDTYAEYFDFTADTYLQSLQIRTKTESGDALFQKIATDNLFALLSKDLPLSEEEVGCLFKTLACYALKLAEEDANTASKYVHFLLPFRFAARDQFIKEGIDACLQRKTVSDEKIFDAFLSTFGNESIDQYLSYQFEYAANRMNRNDPAVFGCISKRLDALVDYAPDSKRLHHLRICAACHSPEKDLPDHFYSLSDFSGIEALISLRDKETVDSVLEPYFKAFFGSIEKEEKTLSEYINAFDTLCSYLPKAENCSLYTRFISIANLAKAKGEFDVAVKYCSILVSEYPSNHTYHWRLLQSKLKCKNDEELIAQDTLLADVPDYGNAKIAAGKDREAIAHYIDVEMKQKERIRIDAEKKAKAKKEAEEQAKKKHRRKIIGLSTFAAITFALALGALTGTVFVPAGKVNQAIDYINSSHYSEAISVLYGTNFGESTNLRNMAYAGQYFAGKNFEKGIDHVVKAGGEVKVSYDRMGGTGKESEVIKPKRGYINNEWSKEGYRFSEWKQKSFSLSVGNGIYFASLALEPKYSLVTYNVTYELNGGTNDRHNPSSYTVESGNITLREPTKTGYTFLGWYDAEGNKVASIPKGSMGNLVLTAHWNDGNEYKVYFDPTSGTLDLQCWTVQYDHEYTLPSATRLGCGFQGWYDGASKIASTGIWKTPNDVNAVAGWSKNIYSITYNLNGGTGASSNPAEYTVESETIVLVDPRKEGYSFQGWYDAEGNKVASIPKGSTGDLHLTARWLGDQHLLVVTSSDEAKGTVQLVAGTGRTGETIEILATPAENCVFKGWYSNGQLVSSHTSHSFEMPDSDYSIEARFLTKAEAEAEEAWNLAHGVTPSLSQDGKTLTYGLYPQTHVNDSSLISSLNALSSPESSGWYLLDGEYYVKQTASPYQGYKFDDGTAISWGTSYWFKCEPIEWRVLSNSNGEALVVSNCLLDVHRYDDSSNNYKESEIRQWLNSDFLSSAFSLGNDSIRTTTVDNSASATDSSSNQYACANTEDKVFLLSFQDYRNSSYGFTDDASRQCKTTDFARARGAYVNPDSPYLNNGWYWTRSPGSDYSDDAWFVGDYGYLGYVYVQDSNSCVRPALTIKIA